MAAIGINHYGKRMDQRIKIPMPTADGKSATQEGTLVDIVESSESWSEYKLSDGNILRVKQVIMQVVKLDKKNATDVDSYSVQAQPIVTVIQKA